MSENEQNFINKINEQQSIIEWQKKAILIREDKIKELEKRLTKVLKWGRTQRDYAHKYYNQIKITKGAKQ